MGGWVPARRRALPAALVALASALSATSAWLCLRAPGSHAEAGVPAFVTGSSCAPGPKGLAPGRHSLARVARSMGKQAVVEAEELKDVLGISTPEDFKANVNEGLVVAMFSSPFCGPCMLVEPRIVQMAGELKGAGVKVLKANLIPGKTGKALKPLFSELGVKELPTFLVFKEGQVQGKVTGTRYNELRQLVDGLL